MNYMMTMTLMIIMILMTMNIKMNKIINFIKKNYIYVNITFLFLTIYIILFPIISNAIKKIFPLFNECTYLRMTGNPCPLCGGTRYIQNMSNVFADITYLFHPFGIIMIFIFGESIYRIYNIITRKKEKTEKHIKKDILIHLLALICFWLYESIYLIKR